MTHFVPIAWNVWQSIHARVQDAAPFETGGLVVQYQAGGILQQISCPISNVSKHPAHNYAGEASATIRAFETAEEYADLGGHIAFEWHNHPTAGPEPSRVDKETYHPARHLLIVSGYGDDTQLETWDTHTWEKASWVML